MAARNRAVTRASDPYSIHKKALKKGLPYRSLGLMYIYIDYVYMYIF